MKCAIHQPQFLPWLGYLHKIVSCDVFVFLDTVQFKKNEFQNRNKIRVGDESRWITVPVSFNFGDTIRETKISDTTNWRHKMKSTLEQNYRKAPYFEEYSGNLFNLIDKKWNDLAEINIATVKWFMEAFDIRTRIIVASEMRKDGDDDVNSSPTDRLISICRDVGADVYVSGQGGKGYLEEEKFDKSDIKLEYQNYLHPEYRQCYTYRKEMFHSNLSAVDGLLNCGGGREGSRRLNLL